MPTKSKKPAARKSAPDAIALLKEDHAKVSKLFEQFEKLGDKAQARKEELVKKICTELRIHTTIEEEVFYPATRAALPKAEDLFDEAQVEHDGAKNLIAQLESMKPGDEYYDAKVTVLAEYIKHHVKEEHEDMFPKVRKTKLDLKELGMRLAFRKQELAKQAGA